MTNTVSFRGLLDAALAGGYAVPSFCVWSLESLVAVVDAADELRAPVILMNGPAEMGYLRPAHFVGMIDGLRERITIPFALHIDHGDTIELAREALDAGYTSVMLDWSHRPFEENAGALAQVTALARPYGAGVEGEIGHVGKADTHTAEGMGDSTLTTPEEAAAYAAATDVDALAVSIGNAHGTYTRLPRFDFDRLAAIHAVVDVPLVLHGGSGTSEEDLHRAIALGIAKVNVATDLVTAWRESLRDQWDHKPTQWAPTALADATRAIREAAKTWILRLGADGKAG